MNKELKEQVEKIIGHPLVETRKESSAILEYPYGCFSLFTLPEGINFEGPLDELRQELEAVPEIMAASPLFTTIAIHYVDKDSDYDDGRTSSAF